MAETQINVGMNVDGVVTGTEKAKRKLSELGGAAREAGKGTGAIGDGMAGSAQKVEAATKNMVSSIQRQIAALEAGDKSSRKYQESLAKMRGIDTAALKPYLDQLDAVKAKQESAARSSESLTASFGAFKAAAVAAAASAGAIALFSKSIIDASDGLNDLSQRVGVSIKELGKYQLAADQSGSSIEAIAKGIKGLAGNMVEHGAALKKAGIDATTADGAMRQLADVFKTMPDGVEKTTLATKLFGKAGMDLIPMLNLGADGLEKAAEASAGFSEQMAIMAPLADQFNDSMSEIAMSSKTAGAVMVNQFLPTLNQISLGFIDAKDDANAFAVVMGKTVNVVMQTAAVVISDVSFVLKAVGREIGGIAAQYVAFMKLDFKGFSAIGDAIKEDAQRGREEHDKFQKDLFSGGASPAGESAYFKRQGFGEKSTTTGNALLSALGGGEKSAKQAITEYQRLNDEMTKTAALAQAELAFGPELSAADKYRVETLNKLIESYQNNKISLQEYIDLEAKMTDIEGTKRMAEESKAALKLANERIALRKKESDAIDDYMRSQAESQAAAVKGSQDALKAAQEEYDQYGMSKSQIAEITLLTLQSAQAKFADGSAGYNAAQKQIDAQRELIGVLKKGEMRESAKAATAEWQKTADTIQTSLTDAFMGAIDSGKSLFVSLRDSVVGMFKNIVLRPIVSAIVNPISTALTGSLIGTAANAATGASATSGIFGNISTGFASSAMGLGLEGSIATIAEQGFIGGFSNAMTSASSLLSAGSPMGAFGAAMPYLGAAVAGLSILKSLGVFGSNFISADDSGRASIDYTAAGIGGSAYNTTGSAAQTAIATKATADLAKAYFDTAKALGVTALQSSFQVGYNTGEEGKNPNTVLGVVAGGKSFSSGEIASGDTAAITLAANRAILTALQASELPEYLSGVFDKITASTATQDQITAAINSAAALAQFHAALQGLPFDTLTNASYAVTQALIAASGGLDALASNVSGFYQNFYSEEEQRAQLVENINRTVGGTFDAASTSAEQFRAIVETSFADTSESGLTLTANLLKVQGGMMTLTEGAKKLDEEAKRITKSLESFAKDSQKLNIELLNAAGQTDAAAEALRTLETDGLSAAEVAAYDYNAAMRAQITAVNDAKAAMTAYVTASRSLRASFNVIDGVNQSPTEIARQSAADALVDLNKSLAPIVKLATVETTKSVQADMGFFEAFPSALAALKSIPGDELAALVSKINAESPGKLSATDLTSPAWAQLAYDTWHANQVGWVDPNDAGIVNVTRPKTTSTDIMGADPAFAGLTMDAALEIARGIAAGTVKSSIYTAEQIAAFSNLGSATAGVTGAENDANKILTDAETEAKKIIQDITDGLKSAGATLAIQILQAKGDTEGALAAQKALDTVGYTAAQIGLYDANKALEKELATLNEKKSLQDQLDTLTLSSVQLLDKQRSALDESNRALFDQIQLEKEKQRQVQVLNDKLSLQAQIYELTGDKVAAAAITEQQRAIELAKLDVTLRPLQTTLWGLQDAATSAATALETANTALDKSKTTSDDAYAALERAVSAQKTVVQETISNVTSIIDSIDSAVKSLRGDANKAAAFTAAQSFLDNALANAKATGYLPDSKELSNAIGDLNAGMADQVYATEADSQFQKLVIAGKLEALGLLAKPQLTAAESQLKALENTLTTARTQLDTLRGIDNSVKSVEDAVKALSAAMGAEKAATATSAALTLSNNIAKAEAAAKAASPYDYSYSYTDPLTGTGYGGRSTTADSPTTARPLPESMQLAIEREAMIAARQALTRYDIGTNYVPSDGPAYLHEGEAVIPKAYNPAAGGNARLESLVEGLTKEVQRLQAIVNAGNKHAERTADATNGRPEQPMLVETV